MRKALSDLVTLQVARQASRTWCLWVFIVIAVAPAFTRAQTLLTRVYGPEDQTVSSPQYVPDTGQKDAAALQLILDYLKAVNVGSWQGMQATGTISAPSKASDEATLTILGGNQYRLDVQTPNGERSTRITGPYGQIQEASGTTLSVFPSAANAGILTFAQLFTMQYSSSSISLFDRGTATINGVLLQRITLEEPTFPGSTVLNSTNTSVIDLYFDPTTHFLVESASWVRMTEGNPERYLLIMRYQDYTNVQGSFLPCSFQESLNGQPQWTLQINTPTLHPAVDPSYFHF